ncbi:MAG: inositol monophosphatase [Gemmatimonadales bacterium]|nr:inositol monophosphatase [Gemmatimonadales bacterium]
MSQLNTTELGEIGIQIRELALAAGEILLSGHGDIHTIESKRGTEFVTEMDRRVEEFLLDELTRRFPGDAIEAEETGGRAGTSGRTWYVDPLDGTTNYAHGYPFFSVSIACADQEELLVGTVLAPYLGELYQAHRGGGSTLERARSNDVIPLSSRKKVGMQSALLATGFPYVRDEIVDLNTGLVRDFLKAGCHGVRRGGSAAIDLVHVAAGKLDGYWELNLRTWDTAAGTLIAREAGALVSGFGGNREILHVENIVAAAPGLHQEMLEMFARAQPGRWPGPGVGYGEKNPGAES